MYPVSPATTEDNPILPKSANVPDIPHEVSVAKVLPAATLPIVDCIPAATEPATIPVLPKPKSVGTAYEPSNPIPPIINSEAIIIFYLILVKLFK
jgi:hypothetical protein